MSPPTLGVAPPLEERSLSGAFRSVHRGCGNLAEFARKSPTHKPSRPAPEVDRVTTTLYVAAGSPFLNAIWGVATSNTFIRTLNKVDEYRSGMDVELNSPPEPIPHRVGTQKTD